MDGIDKQLRTKTTIEQLNMNTFVFPNIATPFYRPEVVEFEVDANPQITFDINCGTRRSILKMKIVLIVLASSAHFEWES
ncbi:MAG TPA: hypothetical protein DIW81_05600 [Planctomycetaceae bacterium]|nr:hypothetical protein [Planctomycetaceae bacterium]|tara:strand:- start:1326 stop:1565 length:240 start_codon:yes stop_codon:yes gene_type:complete